MSMSRLERQRIRLVVAAGIVGLVIGTVLAVPITCWSASALTGPNDLSHGCDNLLGWEVSVVNWIYPVLAAAALSLLTWLAIGLATRPRA